MSVREFPPMFLADDSRVRDGIVSQTFLRAFDGCRRAAYLYETVRGAGSVQMDRGSALHAAIERGVLACVDQAEQMLPPEVAKAILEEVVCEYDVPVAEQDYLRECMFRWANQFEVPLGPAPLVETLFELEVGGLTIRSRVDYAWLSDDGARLVVRDWKSSRGLPAHEEVARKRPDGSYSAKAFQLVLYALSLVFGRPVLVAECGACSGKGYTVAAGPGGQHARLECDVCGERGRVEQVLPEPVAARAQSVELAYVFPGIEDRDGLMATREVSLTPLELHEYLAAFEALGARVRQAVETGDWGARPGAHCAECPAPLQCPIPPPLRSYYADGAVTSAGYVNNLGDASARAALIDRAKATIRAWENELKAWSKANGGVSIPFGRDLEYAFVPVTSETIPDKDGMFLAMERAVQYGSDFDRAGWVQVRTGTRWTRRTRPEAG